MTLLIAGAHGAVGQHVVRQLAEAGHHVRAMIRDDDQADALRALGAAPLLADLTGDVSDTVVGCDAVVFAAGSKGENLEGVDKGGAIKLVDACRAHGVDRFVMLSSFGADDPDGADDLQDYLRAKQAADQHLTESGLTYTVLRPMHLTNGAGTGTAAVGRSLDPEAHPQEVAREDVATALVAALTTSETKRAVIEMTGGSTPIREGLAAL